MIKYSILGFEGGEGKCFLVIVLYKRLLRKKVEIKILAITKNRRQKE